MQAGPGAAKLVPRLGVASVVIPGPERKRGSPESITTSREYGFRARRCAASRNAGESLPAHQAVLPNHFNDALLATSAHLAISCLRNASSLPGDPPT